MNDHGADSVAAVSSAERDTPADFDASVARLYRRSKETPNSPASAATTMKPGSVTADCSILAIVCTDTPLNCANRRRVRPAS